ncbi:MAG: NAD-dependent epimerase/dehydratase family protein [Actinomycetota bacterium]
MKVLVTGGAGFIGSHVVDLLLAEGHSVRVLDSLHPRAHGGRPDYLNAQAEYLFEDVRDMNAVDKAVEGVDAVSHQAAMVGLGAGFGDVDAYVSINCGGTATLLKALWKRQFAGRLVLAGSMVVYGEGRYRCAADGVVVPGRRRPQDLAAGRFDPTCPRCSGPLEPEAVPEVAAMMPRSVYAATKLHQEHLCDAFAAGTGAGFVSLRYHNVYGPRMPADTPYAGVASIFRSSLEAGEAPQVFEDGQQLRDFVHVNDVARANLNALAAPPEVAGAYNVCSGSPRRLIEMAELLRRGYGDGPAAPAPQITGAYRPADVRHVFADPGRAERELGFRAQVPFEQGVARFAREPLRLPATQLRAGD